MNVLYYKMIFKRKIISHFFRELALFQRMKCQEIQNHVQELQPLVKGIRTEFHIVPRDQTTCTRGEYCILLYSEVKEHYLLNAGLYGGTT